jgi:hypothetical protein
MHVALVWPTLTLYPCVQQYPTLLKQVRCSSSERGGHGFSSLGGELLVLERLGWLDVGTDFGEHCIGDHQVLDGGILFNGRICQSVERRSHLLCLFEFIGLICAKRCVSGSHAIDVMHFGKGGGPM